VEKYVSESYIIAGHTKGGNQMAYGAAGGAGFGWGAGIGIVVVIILLLIAMGIVF
jgi:hypothetical protein